MSVALRLAVAVGALTSACSVNLTNKTACSHDTDCVDGYVCVVKTMTCVPDSGSGGTAGGGRGGGGGGNPGTIDGGPDASPPHMCPTTPVTACSDPSQSCEEILCGGLPWRYGVLNSVLVPYQIVDPGLSPSYRNAIRAGAAAWARASSGLVTFQDCGNLCSGRFISVVAGDGDGITNPHDAVELLPMPAVGSVGRVSPHWIAHQWGHVLGLSHTYERADRDRYVGFDPELCPPGGSGLPPRCAAGPQGMPGLPAVTTGTFGAFDEKSKMNGFQSEGICGAEEPDEDSGEPTLGDVSAVAELFFGAATSWSPFQPIGRSLSPNQPLDYQLAPGVDPMGSPAIAEVDYASPEIFVRGTDDRVYTTSRRDPLNSPTADWLDWTVVDEDVDADPAVVFSLYGNPETLFLATRSRLDADNIHLRARRGGAWGPWTSLAAPPSGAASAPALASESPTSLDVLVRGGDGLIYRLACMDAVQDCVAASALGPDAWTALPAPPSGIFVGKPSAVWMLTGALTVAAVRDDRVAMVNTGVNTGGSGWMSADNVNAYLAADDPDPGVAITMVSTPGDVNFFARSERGLLVSETLLSKFFPIGGVLASPPGVVSVYHVFVRTDVAAIIDDHGHPGVWWRYSDGNYMAPCNYNSPGTCGQCGLP